MSQQTNTTHSTFLNYFVSKIYILFMLKLQQINAIRYLQILVYSLSVVHARFVIITDIYQ